jgi:hypothetical protein
MAGSLSRKCPDLTFLHLKSFAGRALGRVHLELAQLICDPDQKSGGNVFPISGNPFPPRRERVRFPAGKPFPTARRLTGIGGCSDSPFGSRAQASGNPIFHCPAFRIALRDRISTRVETVREIVGSSSAGCRRRDLRSTWRRVTACDPRHKPISCPNVAQALSCSWRPTTSGLREVAEPGPSISRRPKRPPRGRRCDPAGRFASDRPRRRPPARRCLCRCTRGG